MKKSVFRFAKQIHPTKDDEDCPGADTLSTSSSSSYSDDDDRCSSRVVQFGDIIIQHYRSRITEKDTPHLWYTNKDIKDLSKRNAMAVKKYIEETLQDDDGGDAATHEEEDDDNSLFSDMSNSDSIKLNIIDPPCRKFAAVQAKHRQELSQDWTWRGFEYVYQSYSRKGLRQQHLASVLNAQKTCCPESLAEYIATSNATKQSQNRARMLGMEDEYEASLIHQERSSSTTKKPASPKQHRRKGSTSSPWVIVDEFVQAVKWKKIQNLLAGGYRCGGSDTVEIHV